MSLYSLALQNEAIVFLVVLEGLLYIIAEKSVLHLGRDVVLQLELLNRYHLLCLPGVSLDGKFPGGNAKCWAYAVQPGELGKGK